MGRIDNLGAYMSDLKTTETVWNKDKDGAGLHVVSGLLDWETSSYRAENARLLARRCTSRHGA